MTMTMDQLFAKLPRDLQWEVLSEFVGTHAVRNGKLMQKIDFTKFNVKIRLRRRDRAPWLSKRNADALPGYIRLSTNVPISFWEDPHTGDTIYLNRTMERDPFIPFWKVHFTPERIEDTVVLAPFVKHTYPSYPYTNKKNAKRRSLD